MLEQLTPGIILVGILLFLLVIYMFSSCSLKCNSSEPYAPTGYVGDCEFSDACAYNGAQTCTLWGNLPHGNLPPHANAPHGGRAGNCTLHGLCCPSFSTDQSRMQEQDLPESVIGARYQRSYQRMIEDDDYD
uniref:Uncharacterized protein n=1 Tax=Marseillevirus LCMAC101 TaxID=2506602 RepID=A0A481YQS4_9VIRU|nr:MAG: hypothetical protein LCMAC101_01150 [Marseillevirus LCMAC101]